MGRVRQAGHPGLAAAGRVIRMPAVPELPPGRLLDLPGRGRYAPAQRLAQPAELVTAGHRRRVEDEQAAAVLRLEPLSKYSKLASRPLSRSNVLEDRTCSSFCGGERVDE